MVYHDLAPLNTVGVEASFFWLTKSPCLLHPHLEYYETEMPLLIVNKVVVVVVASYACNTWKFLSWKISQISLKVCHIDRDRQERRWF